VADWLYCGSGAAVNAAGTQSLLRTYRAIWCSPSGLQPLSGTPQPGERLWLVCRDSSPDRIVLLLGGGRIQQAPRALYRSNLLWMDPDAVGVRAAARQLGYAGPNSMSFLRLAPVVFPAGRPPVAA